MDKKDVAIKHKRDDLLNRKKLARKISDYILSYKDIEPLTIGIIGKWGSGKSSLINLILCYLEFEIKNNPLDKDYIIIHFNPWFFSNQENLYLQFFKLIIEKITTHGYEKYSLFERATTHRRSIFKKLKIETLDEYVNFLQSNQTVPDNIMTYGLNSNQIESYYSLLAHKEFCDEYFEDSKYKIIVIIDDIDRLNDKEIKKVITLVKSLADFKNFIYILSFDKDIVAKSLATLQSDKGDKFLDKIVQIPINVPEVNQSRMDMIIFNELSEIYNSRLNNFINKDKDLMEILPYLTVFIKDLRDLKRYKNMLNFYINNFDDELNIDDFFVLLALQVFESKIFSILPKYKDILTTHRRKFMVDSIKKETTANFNKYVKNNLINVDLESMNKVLNYLFPELKSSNFSIDELTQNNRIGSSHHFYKYFSFSLESNDVSVTLLDNLINCNDENEISKMLTKSKNYDYNHFLLRQLCLSKHNIPFENIETFIKSLIKNGEIIHLYRDDFKYIYYILNDLFTRINNHDKTFEILMNSDFENSFFTILELVYSVFYKYNNEFSKLEKDLEIDSKQKNELKKDIIISSKQMNKLKNDLEISSNQLVKIEEDMIITFKQMSELEKIMINTIKQYCENGNLLNHPRLKTILSYWKNFESTDVVKKYLDENVNEDMEVLNFISKFHKNKPYSSSWGELIKVESEFDFKELEKWKDLETLIKQIKDIYKNEDYSDDIKDFCKLIIKKYDEYWEFNKHFL